MDNERQLSIAIRDAEQMADYWRQRFAVVRRRGTERPYEILPVAHVNEERHVVVAMYRPLTHGGSECYGGMVGDPELERTLCRYVARKVDETLLASISERTAT